MNSKIASTLKKLLKFQEASLVKEQKVQQDNQFLTGRQITCMICDYFKFSGTGEAVLDFNVEE